MKAVASAAGSAAGSALAAAAAVALDLARLAKPRITVLVLVTVAFGWHLAPTAPGAGALWAALAGVGLVVAAANALNQHIERDTDARMARTADRPLPAGRLAPPTAVAAAAVAAAAGTALLALAVNGLTALLAAASLALYAGVYTPLKRVTPLALWVGAVPGAAPPLLGWTAAAGAIDAGAAALFAILYCWQVPHFLALTILYREEFARAGLRVHAVAFGEAATRRHLVWTTALLVAVSLVAAAPGGGGAVYLAAAAALGAVFLTLSARALADGPARRRARAAFLWSLAYLPALLAALALD